MGKNKFTVEKYNGHKDTKFTKTFGLSLVSSQ